MVSGSIARRYARALMDIGVAQGSYERIGRDVRDLAAAIKASPELSEALVNPAFPRSERRKVLEAVMDRLHSSPISRNFTLLLLDRDRVAALPDISRELDRMIDDKIGRVKADVVSATPLTPAQEGRLKRVLESLSGKSVQLDKRQDPELLGGVIATIGDYVYDGSLRTQLRQVRDAMVK
jgi:F-type H+-transporting ATPase subunit delta